MSLSNKLSISDVDLNGKRVLIRVSPAKFPNRAELPGALSSSNINVLLQVDFNVPLDADKKVTNNQRIAGALPTIKYALSMEPRLSS